MPNVELERKQEPPDKAYTTCSISPHPIKTVCSSGSLPKYVGMVSIILSGSLYLFHSRYLFPFSEPMSDFRRFHMAADK